MTYITEIYCQNTVCNVRQCEIVTKDYDGPDPASWKCPGCGGEATVHWRRDLQEDARHRLRDAIGVVNAALYAREHPDDFMGWPVGVLVLESLPESWKCEG